MCLFVLAERCWGQGRGRRSTQDLAGARTVAGSGRLSTESQVSTGSHRIENVHKPPVLEDVTQAQVLSCPDCLTGQGHWSLRFTRVTSRPHAIKRRKREDTASQELKQGMGIRTCNTSFHGVALYQVQIRSASTFLGGKILAAEIDYKEHTETQGMPSWGRA